MVTPNGPRKVGGVERHVREVSSRLVNMGHVVDVLCAEAGLAQSVTEPLDGFTVTTVPAWPRDRDWLLSREIWSRVRLADSDLVHVQSYHTFVAPIAMAAAARARRPYLVTFHGGGHSDEWRNRIRLAQRIALRPLLAKAERLVAVAPFEIELYGSELRLPADRFVLIPNGTELGISSAQGSDPDEHAERSEGEAHPVLATIGRLERYKGHHRVIAAMPALLRVVPDARLLVVGSGRYEENLRADVQALGLGQHVEFTSVLAGDAAGMSALLKRVSLVVLMSEFETHPLTALEAVAAGKRLLVADRAGLLGIAESGMARASPLDSSPEELATAIIETLRQPPPSGKVELPTWDDCASSLEQLYRELIPKTT